MSHVIAWTIWVPLAGAILTFLIRSHHVRTVGLAASVATALAAATAVWYVWSEGEQRYPVGGWGAPLGIDLAADGLSVLMLAMTAGVGVLVSWYAWGYFRIPKAPAAGDDGPASPPWGEADSF